MLRFRSLSPVIGGLALGAALLGATTFVADARSADSGARAAVAFEPTSRSSTIDEPTETEGPRATPTTTPTTDSTMRPTPTTRPATESTATTPTTASVPAAEVRTLDAAGAGSVVYRLEGSTLTLVSATPSTGWRVEVEQSAGREIDLDFRSGTRRVQVDIEFEDGAARERVRPRDDADDDD